MSQHRHASLVFALVVMLSTAILIFADQRPASFFAASRQAGLRQAGAPPAAPLDTYTVNRNTDEPDANPADNICDVNLAQGGSQCTFRAAIQTANNHLGLDSIVFNIGGGAPLISVGATAGPSQGQPLPSITDPVMINGNTGGATRVQIDGNSLNVFAHGLFFTGASGGSTVESMVITRFMGNGIEFFQVDANTVRDSYLGVMPNGASGGGNLAAGVSINNSSNNLIGGPISRDRNIISANGFGIDITGPATENVIQGNYIGTNAAGNAALGNLVDGIILGAASGNQIGGVPAPDSGNCNAPCNLISANASDGIEISVNAAEGANLVQGNFIGTDITGTQELGNGDNGILLRGSPDNTIGGSDPGAGNLISGNAQHGILIQFANNQVSGLILPTGNQIQGNRIGTQTDSTTPLGNHFEGIRIQGGTDNVIGGVADTSTSACTGACNIIAFNGTDNGGAGIRIEEASLPVLNTAVRNTITRNSIHDNAALGIDLANDGITPNDEGDPDTGPNNRQNYPTLLVATTAAATFHFNSAPNTNYTIEFFSNAACDASGNGEGQQFIGSVDVVTDANGNITPDPFLFTFPSPISSGLFVTATATEISAPKPQPSNPDVGDTSEFSNCLAVGGVATLTATPTGPTPTQTPTNTPSGNVTPSPTPTNPGEAADLVVAKTDSPDPVQPGRRITYHITIINNGPNAAADVTFADSIPAHTRFISITPSSGGVCNGPSSSGVVGCTWPGATTSGSSRTVTLVVRVRRNTAQGTIIYNTAGAVSRTSDPNFNNNQATTQTLVQTPATPTPTRNPGADLTLDKTGQSGTGGNPIIFRLKVTNQGPLPAQRVRVLDKLPDVVAYDSSSTTKGRCRYIRDVHQVRCRLGTLQPGQVVTIQIVTHLARFEQVFENCARVRSTTFDPNLRNNRSCVVVQLGEGKHSMLQPGVGERDIGLAAWLMRAWSGIVNWLTPQDRMVALAL